MIASGNKNYLIAILEVLVLQRFPYGKESAFFYYAKGKTSNIREGDIVQVPWRSKMIGGVVVKTSKIAIQEIPEGNWKINLQGQIQKDNGFYSSVPNKNIVLKPIDKILEKKFFSPHLILKLKELAENYLVSWNHFACLAVELPSKQKNIQDVDVLGLLKKWRGIYKKNISSGGFLKVERKKIRNVPYVFVSPEQTKFLKALIGNSIARGKQILVLAPEKSQIIPVAAKYASLMKKNSQDQVFILSKILAKSYFKKVWQSARQISPAIFVGSRSAIFAPYKKLDLIILEDGHDSSHKQWDMNPRYDLRDLLPKLYPQAAKIYVSATPRFQDFYASPFIFKANKKSLKIFKVTLPETFNNRKNKNIENIQEKNITHILEQKILFQGKTKKLILVNQKIENNLSGEKSALGEFIERTMIDNLQKKKWVVVIAPHKGWANLAICKDCGHIPVCSKCQKPLLAEKNSLLMCPACGNQSDSNCPKCQKSNFIFLNPGIEKIKEEIMEMKSKIKFSLIVPPKNFTSFKRLQYFLDKLLDHRGKSVVFLGYSGLVSLLNYFNENLGLGIFLSFDNVINQPDFRSEERAVARFYNLLSLASKLIIQSYNPDEAVLRELAKNPYSSFFARWAAERKPFHYPPFGRLIKLMLPRMVPWEQEKIIFGIRKEDDVLDVLKITSGNKSGEILVKMRVGSSIKNIARFLPMGTKADIDPEKI